MTINFDSITNDINSLKADIFCMMGEFQEIQTNYDELLECLGATDRNSALDAIRELKAALGSPAEFTNSALDAIRAMKAALGSQVVAAPVVIEPTIKFSNSTALTPTELATIITQSLSKAIDNSKATTPAVKKVRTFGDIAGVS